MCEGCESGFFDILTDDPKPTKRKCPKCGAQIYSLKVCPYCGYERKDEN